MSLRDRASAGRSCPDFETLSDDGKRCMHYRDKLCELSSTHPLCEEWLKANPRGDLPDESRFTEARAWLNTRPDYRLAVITGSYFAPGWKGRAVRALGGNPTGALADADAYVADALSASTSPTSESVSAQPDRFPSEIELARWRQLGVEICMVSPTIGELWLVPKYTKEDRAEITPEDALTILRLLCAFPGAKVEQFIRKNVSA